MFTHGDHLAHEVVSVMLGLLCFSKKPYDLKIKQI